MYYDLGFDDWIFEIEETEGEQIADQLKKVYKDYGSAKQRVRANKDNIAKIYKDSCEVIKELV